MSRSHQDLGPCCSRSRGLGAILLQAVHPFDYPDGGKVSRVKENSDDRLKRSFLVYESGAFALSSFADLALRTHGRILDANAHC